MELIPILATIIVVTTIVTLVFALLSYVAYRSRERRAPRVQHDANVTEFFTRYQPRR
jgi:heme/copper-type cytochrome/quinol oxidase subunit 2